MQQGRLHPTRCHLAASRGLAGLAAVGHRLKVWRVKLLLAR